MLSITLLNHRMDIFPLDFTQDPATLKDEGNTLFKAGDMKGAACCYSKAIKLCDVKAERAVLYRNRSACYLKLEDYTKAEADASKGWSDISNTPPLKLRSY